ncbi:unnamed protein product [Prorocentrum cordatum]|uniref:Uncharacterized protein n=1 Tax=Prorocentrum cordatum TaxID=2364126 RepID=A0ABN9WN46_9DINO|nr:unnamed protein product [Polarella glacialis]
MSGSRAPEGVDITSVATGVDKFWGITAVGTKIVAAPRNSDKLLVYDTEPKAVEGVDITSVATGVFKFWGVTAVVTKILAAPWNSGKLLVYDLGPKAVEGVEKAWGTDLLQLQLTRRNVGPLERELATAASGESRASGNGVSAARSLGPSAQIQALTQVVEELGAPPGTLGTASAFRGWLASKGVAKETKFSARKILFGRPAEATQGIGGLTGVQNKEVFKRVTQADDSGDRRDSDSRVRGGQSELEVHRRWPMATGRC